MDWIAADKEEAKRLWAEDGYSAGQIVLHFGRRYTRNQIIGVMHRAGLHRSHNVSRLPMAPKVSMRTHTPPAPVVEEDPVTLSDGSHATVLTINDRMCRWPIGDPSADEFHFCGRSPKSGSPYCEAHARKAYQPKHPQKVAAHG